MHDAKKQKVLGIPQATFWHDTHEVDQLACCVVQESQIWSAGLIHHGDDVVCVLQDACDIRLAEYASPYHPWIASGYSAGRSHHFGVLLGR